MNRRVLGHLAYFAGECLFLIVMSFAILFTLVMLADALLWMLT